MQKVLYTVQMEKYRISPHGRYESSRLCDVFAQHGGPRAGKLAEAGTSKAFARHIAKNRICGVRDIRVLECVRAGEIELSHCEQLSDNGKQRAEVNSKIVHSAQHLVL